MAWNSIRDRIDDPDLRRLFDYWDDRRGDRMAPPRDAIDPTEMVWIIGRLMLIETAGQVGRFRVRLFGSKIAEEFGEDRTGMYFDEILRVENLDEVFARYEQVHRDARPHYEGGRTVSDLRSYRGYSRLLLPLSEDGRTVSAILAGLTFFGRTDQGGPRSDAAI